MTMLCFHIPALFLRNADWIFNRDILTMLLRDMETLFLRNRLWDRVAFFLRDLIALFHRFGGMNLLWNIKALMNWLAAAFSLLVVSMANIMARLLIRGFTLLAIDCLVGGLVDEVALLVFDCGAELLVSCFVYRLAFWLIAEVTLCLHTSLVRC